MAKIESSILSEPTIETLILMAHAEWTIIVNQISVQSVIIGFNDLWLRQFNGCQRWIIGIVKGKIR